MIKKKNYIENHHPELNTKYFDVSPFNVVPGNIYSTNSHNIL